MLEVQKLKEKRAKLISDARAGLEPSQAEKRDVTPEEDAKFKELMAAAKVLEERAKDWEEYNRQQAWADDSAGRSADPAAPGGPAAPPTLPAETRSYLDNLEPGDRAPMERRAGPTYAAAFRAGLRHGPLSNEFRALQADVDTAGGYLVTPLQFVNGLIKAMDNMTFIRQFSTVHPVLNAESLGCPTLDTDPAAPTWTGEISEPSEDSSMAFGRRELTPHPLTKLIKVSQKLLRQTNVEALVMSRLAYVFGITAENAYLNGTGSGQPLGLMIASDDGVSDGRDMATDNTTTAITADNLLNNKYNLKGQYLANARWAFHRDALLQIAKLADGEGQYIWQPGLKEGQPDRLLNLPIHSSEYMPNTFTAGLYVGILGDFRHYWIADALNMAVQRLVELYAATRQVGFIGQLESDGMPVLEEAFTRVTLAAS